MNPLNEQRQNKTDAGNGSDGICRVIDAFRTPLPDQGRYAKKQNHSPWA